MFGIGYLVVCGWFVLVRIVFIGYGFGLNLSIVIDNLIVFCGGVI